MVSNRVENRAAGVAWMLATMLCFIALDAIMKLGMERYSLVQITWGRFFFASLCAAIICGKRLPTLTLSNAPKIQIARSVLLMITTGLFNAGVWQVPLATATTIMFLSPILVTVLSVFLLHELVGLRRWAGIIVGFVGAMIVVEPWQTNFEAAVSGSLFLVAASFTNALYQIMTRRLHNEHPLTSLLFTAVAGAIFTSAILPWHWQAPDLIGWAMMLGSGIAGCLGHLCLIKAFQNAPASVVAPFAYSSLIWATLLGVLIWQEIPGFTTWIGASLIVAAGLYIYLPERQIRKAY